MAIVLKNDNTNEVVGWLVGSMQQSRVKVSSIRAVVLMQ